MSWDVRASDDFWATVARLRSKYAHEEYVAIIRTVREAIEELKRYGHVSETGWSEHELRRPPYGDGCHFEFHIHDDDVLVVYFKRVKRKTIRMVGVFDHATIPRS